MSYEMEDEAREPEIIFTYELSTVPFNCECGATVEPNTKILFRNDDQLNLCSECMRDYLRQSIINLQYTEYTFAIRDNTSIAN